MTATIRSRWLATALAAAVLALASQLAQAHGGHHHEPKAVPEGAIPRQAAGTPVAVGRIAPFSAQAAWSQSCPDGSGGDCCCKHEPAVAGAAKVAIVDSSGWVRPASSPVARLQSPPAESRSQQSFVSRARPRAPPSFS